MLCARMRSCLCACGDANYHGMDIHLVWFLFFEGGGESLARVTSSVSTLKVDTHAHSTSVRITLCVKLHYIQAASV